MMIIAIVPCQFPLAIQVANSDDMDSGNLHLPSLSTKEKLDKMSASTSDENNTFASRGSHRSSASLRSSLSSGSDSKGIK